MNNLTIDNYIQIGLLIITIVSVLSPTIATIINSIHDTNIKKLEINSKIKQEILNSFAEKINYLNGYSSIALEFYKYLNLLNIYFDDVDNEFIEYIAKTQYKGDIAFQRDVNKLMQTLAKQVKYK